MARRLLLYVLGMNVMAVGIRLGTVISAWLIGRSVGAAAHAADASLDRWLRA